MGGEVIHRLYQTSNLPIQLAPCKHDSLGRFSQRNVKEGSEGLFMLLCRRVML